MREILFRGKRKDNGEWVEGLLKIHLVDGDLTKKENECYITVQWMDEIGKVYRIDYEVIPETVGQYQEVIDVFEGDALYGEEFGEYNTKLSSWVGIVKNNPEKGRVMILDDIRDWYEIDDFDFDRVIGNIHDNPELLEVKPCESCEFAGRPTYIDPCASCKKIK